MDINYIIIEELREILKLKDERIKELEEVIRLLKTKSIQVPKLDINQIQQLQLLDRVYNSDYQHNCEYMNPQWGTTPICKHCLKPAKSAWFYDPGPTSGAW